MIRLKIIILLSILTVYTIISSGCGQSGNDGKKAALSNSGNGTTFTIVTSFYPVFISTINVTRDVAGVKVKNMTKPQTGCLHDYSLTPEDLKTLEKADAFIVNGAGMEAFMERVIKQRPGLKIVDAGRDIKPLKDKNGEENPHVWVSISNCMLQVKNIAKQLASIDTANAVKYKDNADRYVKKLEALKDRMHKALDRINNRDIITFHEAFPYFAKEFNLHIAAVIEREPGSEPSPKELGDIVEKIRKLKIEVLFVETQYSSRIADTIARETGSKVYTLDPAVTGEAGSDAYDAYLDIMERNLKTLQKALK